MDFLCEESIKAIKLLDTEFESEAKVAEHLQGTNCFTSKNGKAFECNDPRCLYYVTIVRDKKTKMFQVKEGLIKHYATFPCNAIPNDNDLVEENYIAEPLGMIHLLNADGYYKRQKFK